MKWIPVAGTAARKRHDHADSWYRSGSPLDRVLDNLGYQRVDQNGDPNKPDKGFWSGDINGLMLQRALWWRDKHPAWKTGGEALRKFLLSQGAPSSSDGVTLVLHSHAGQVGAYALANCSRHLARRPDPRDHLRYAGAGRHASSVYTERRDWQRGVLDAPV